MIIITNMFLLVNCNFEYNVHNEENQWITGLEYKKDEKDVNEEYTYNIAFRMYETFNCVVEDGCVIYQGLFYNTMSGYAGYRYKIFFVVFSTSI